MSSGIGWIPANTSFIGIDGSADVAIDDTQRSANGLLFLAPGLLRDALGLLFPFLNEPPGRLPTQDCGASDKKGVWN